MPLSDADVQTPVNGMMIARDHVDGGDYHDGDEDGMDSQCSFLLSPSLEAARSCWESWSSPRRLSPENALDAAPFLGSL